MRRLVPDPTANAAHAGRPIFSRVARARLYSSHREQREWGDECENSGSPCSLSRMFFEDKRTQSGQHGTGENDPARVKTQRRSRR